MAVIAYRRSIICDRCYIVKLESEPLLHYDQCFGAVCANRDRSGHWTQAEAFVLLQSNLHQEVRWFIKPPGF